MAYYVLNTRRADCPRVIHQTKQEAVWEAERLAPLHPETEFLVLKVEKMVVHRPKYAARIVSIPNPPANHCKTWTPQEKKKVAKAVDTFIKQQASAHKRTLQSLAFATVHYLQSEGVK